MMTKGQPIIAAAAAFEAATGLVLLVAQSLLAKLLLGVDIAGPALLLALTSGRELRPDA